MPIKVIKKAIKYMIRFTIAISILFCIFMSLVFYCNFKPFRNLRTLWVTTAMSTFNHQWLATMFISQTEIDRILNQNKVVTTSVITDTSKIKIKAIPSKSSSTTVASTTTVNTVYSDSDNISMISIKDTNYTGKLMIVDNPSRIQLALIDNFGKNYSGLRLSVLAQKYNAVAAINASGFQDSNGQGNGGIPTGLVVKDGKILYSDDVKSFNIIGFDFNHRLITGEFTLDDIKKNNIKDAVSFGPSLIVNGTPTTIIGDGGWGIQPRTAIGQTADGKVLLLEIDGRQPLYSLGATIKEVQNIMIKYGALNASNLDGGSSTSLYYNGDIINKPCGPMASTGGRYLPTAFIVTK